MSFWWMYWLSCAGVLVAVVVVFVALEWWHDLRFRPGLPVRVPSRPGYRGWAWHVEDGRARPGA